MQTGIYEIVNTVNGKRYVGSSVNIASRWKSHLRELRRGTHHAKHLQHSFNIYGEEKFILVIVRYCERDDLLYYEQEELDSGFDYNSSPTAGNTLGFKFSPEARERVRQNRLRRMKEGDDLPEQMMRMSKMPKSDLWKEKMAKFQSERERTQSEIDNMRKGMAILAEDKVRQVREMRGLGITLKEISRLTGVSWSQAQRICQGRRYAWVK